MQYDVMKTRYAWILGYIQFLFSVFLFFSLLMFSLLSLIKFLRNSAATNYAVINSDNPLINSLFDGLINLSHIILFNFYNINKTTAFIHDALPVINPHYMQFRDIITIFVVIFLFVTSYFLRRIANRKIKVARAALDEIHTKKIESKIRKEQ